MGCLLEFGHEAYHPRSCTDANGVVVQAAPRPRRFKETTNSKWDDYYEAESPPAYPPLQRISSARQGSFSDKALLLLSGQSTLRLLIMCLTQASCKDCSGFTLHVCARLSL